MSGGDSAPPSSTGHAGDDPQVCGLLGWVSGQSEAEVAAIRFKAHSLLRRYYETTRTHAGATNKRDSRARRALMRKDFSSLDRAGLAKACRDMLAVNTGLNKENSNSLKYHYLARYGKYY